MSLFQYYGKNLVSSCSQFYSGRENLLFSWKKGKKRENILCLFFLFLSTVSSVDKIRKGQDSNCQGR